MVLEWAPDGNDSTPLVSPPPRSLRGTSDLARAFDMLDTNALGRLEGDELNNALEALDVPVGEQFCTMSEITTRGGWTREVFGEAIVSRSVYAPLQNRFYAVLSLPEAEAIRAYAHQRRSMDLVPDAPASYIVIHNTHAPESPLDVLCGLGVPAVRARGAYLTRSVLESVRFLDSEHHFSDAAVDAVLRAGVQRTEPIARKNWYDEIRACRRRPKIPGLALGAGDPRVRGASTFVSGLPSDALGIASLFRAEDEFERLALRCMRTRVAKAITSKGLHAVDAFRAFDTSRTGLVNCGELWGGLEWLGVPDLTEDRIYELMRLLDRDNDGLLALHEFKTAFTVNDSDAKLDCRQSLVNNSLPSSLAGIKPKPIIELAVAREVTRQLARKPLTKAILTKVKVKAHPQTQFTSVWTSRGVGAHTNCGVWAPNVSLGLHKANRHRLYLGHYAHKGLKDPARDIKHQRMTLEVTDLNVLRLKTSDSLASVIAELFPSPLHWRQVWNTIGKRIGGHFYAWAAVPPSPEFARYCATK